MRARGAPAVTLRASLAPPMLRILLRARRARQSLSAYSWYSCLSVLSVPRNACLDMSAV